MKCFKYVITNPSGIHARPATMLVTEAKNCQGKVEISKGEKKVDATKLMALLGMGIRQGQEVCVSIEGENEEEDYKKLEYFFKKNL